MSLFYILENPVIAHQTLVDNVYCLLHSKNDHCKISDTLTLSVSSGLSKQVTDSEVCFGHSQSRVQGLRELMLEAVQ